MKDRKKIKTLICVDGPLKGRKERLKITQVVGPKDDLVISFNTVSGTHRYHGERGSNGLVVRPGARLHLLYDDDQMEGFERDIVRQIPELGFKTTLTHGRG